MNIEKENELIEEASKLTWGTQSILTRKEDKLLALRSPFIASSLDRNIDLLHRYLCLGSIPFLMYDVRNEAEKKGTNLINALWQYELMPMYNDLINRPTMPTGCLDPKYMIIGDAPGAGDGELKDRFDRVFVYGTSSHMLRKALILESMHYSSWYTNLLKLATPRNRPSTNEEVIAHKYMLDKEILFLNPKVIILLGNHVNEMFHRHFSYPSVQTVKILHPAYVIRKNMTPHWYASSIERVLT